MLLCGKRIEHELYTFHDKLDAHRVPHEKLPPLLVDNFIGHVLAEFQCCRIIVCEHLRVE